MITYPYLPKGKEIKYVSIENKFMSKARDYAMKHATDIQHMTGSLIVRDNRIIGYGANQVPIKNKIFNEYHRSGLCVRKFFKVKTGEKYWLCPGCAKFSDHSEQRAIKDAKKKGHDTNGADLYLYGHWWCCKPCWDKIIDAGIRDVFLLKGSEKFFNPKFSENILGKNNKK